ncbi:Fur family transcriptional regulator [Thalassotalea hakodatensis]|uniref:Fur family transcriptional regulator n=1 Tax=Thalassotalea hakodatensis TaxID=3030492 RepID=UPI0025736D3D|nr:transcriptional repressor [Thalassotalea hakodatensis]
MTQCTFAHKVKTSEEQLRIAEAHCERHGSKLTPIRQQVLSLLLNTERAQSAYELIELFENTYSEKMAPMSIYRTLDYLVKVHLVHKINVANKFVACAFIDNEKDHDVTQLLFCQQCQQVQELPINHAIEECLTDEVTRFGYQLCTHQIELTCICAKCMPT